MLETLNQLYNSIKSNMLTKRLVELVDTSYSKEILNDSDFEYTSIVKHDFHIKYKKNFAVAKRNLLAFSVDEYGTFLLNFVDLHSWLCEKYCDQHRLFCQIRFRQLGSLAHFPFQLIRPSFTGWRTGGRAMTRSEGIHTIDICL